MFGGGRLRFVDLGGKGLDPCLRVRVRQAFLLHDSGDAASLFSWRRSVCVPARMNLNLLRFH